MDRLTIFVNYDLNEADIEITRLAANLAEQLDADAIGVAACQPIVPFYADGYVSAEVIEEDRKRIEAEVGRAEARFRDGLRRRAIKWHADIGFTPAADCVAVHARAADFILASAPSRKLPFYTERHVNLGDLVMHAGRPVLLVPEGANNLKLGCMMIGWKDTRETRRAVADALPLLKRADRVVIVEMASADDLDAAKGHVEDVSGWLARHGIMAEAKAVTATGNDASQLEAVAQQHGADLVVAGAYGHNRLREWVLGGVTRDLLLCPSRPVLVSH
jgi:nucleotide-binding universal stress UspA family protein